MLLVRTQFIFCCRKMHMKRAEMYQHCFRILGVNENSDQNTVRRAYIELVKKVHPDSGQPEASNEQFQLVDEAFKLLQEKFAKNRRNIYEDEQETVQFDIRHTAPQHRQYLNLDGVGVGTPFQREKQYQQARAMKAQERVLKHRIEKSTAGENALIKKGGSYYRKHAVKTKYGIERVVEDLIQEAMSKGDFENLNGSGKPLSAAQSQNPYLDFTTHKMNKIMLDNGFTPEWIALNREIRQGIKQLKHTIAAERAYYGDYPLSAAEEHDWQGFLQSLEAEVSKLNKSIDKYNLIVPLLDNQFFRLNLELMADKILKSESMERNRPRSKPTQDAHESSLNPSNFLSIFGKLF